jgi:hypothetical protein
MSRHAFLWLFPTLLCASAAWSEPPRLAGPRLRFLDLPATRLTADAIQRSPTIRSFAERIEASDLLVYVRLQFERQGRSGSTRLIASSAGTRFVLVTVNPIARRDDLVARLGHELQHVLEIAAAPDVQDDGGMRALFGRIGYRSAPDGWETDAAITTAHRVYQEMWTRPAVPTTLARR